jgi:hypothetical protein
MKTDNCLPLAMQAAWTWVVAIDAYDYNHRQPLADLVASEPVPDELRPIIAAIVAGDRQPNLRGAAKLKLPAAERMQIAASLMAIMKIIDTLKYEAIDITGAEPDLRGAGMFEIVKGGTASGIMRHLESESRRAVKLATEHYGVSTETIENLLRDFRRKMKAYPDI